MCVYDSIAGKSIKALVVLSGEKRVLLGEEESFSSGKPHLLLYGSSRVRILGKSEINSARRCYICAPLSAFMVCFQRFGFTA